MQVSFSGFSKNIEIEKQVVDKAKDYGLNKVTFNFIPAKQQYLQITSETNELLEQITLLGVDLATSVFENKNIMFKLSHEDQHKIFYKKDAEAATKAMINSEIIEKLWTAENEEITQSHDLKNKGELCLYFSRFQSLFRKWPVFTAKL